MSDRSTQVAALATVAIGAMLTASQALAGDAGIAAFTALIAGAMTVSFLVRGRRADERVRYAELRAAEVAITVSGAAGVGAGTWQVAVEGDPTPWLVMTGIIVGVYTLASVLAIART
ncbi:MAG: hypothetical protein AB7I38_05045 [Dehalococcoidia bacterium]